MAAEELVILSSCGIRFRIKHVIAESRQYKVQRTKIEIPHRLHES